jgi:hypothetical protein
VQQWGTVIWSDETLVQVGFDSKQTIVSSGLVRMGIGIGLGIGVFKVNFHAGFNELVCVWIALPLIEAFINFDHSGLFCHMRSIYGGT